MNEETEKKPTTFAETRISRHTRRTVIRTLKGEGFSKKQLNKMAFGRVFKLYIDSSHWEMEKIIESMEKRTEAKSHE